ncbi:hypothetical protein [Caulobacter sp. S45]|uniref:hypothetical protein n=1 Tax=Caulobacter sp. S45 TaxID=1641861 RepID=UPI00157706D6|nr:hypothetical protein [Caulobacter sp. S45]
MTTVTDHGPAADAIDARRWAAVLSRRVQPAAPSLAFVTLVLLLAVGGHVHRPWFDEAQAWLIARDASPWTLLAHAVRYEGSPGLWHLLLQAAQRLGLPFKGLWLVSSCLSALGAWLVLFRSPFPIALRIGLAFSYFFAFQYAVVARSYALDAALLPLIATLFPGRGRAPVSYAALLGLLANCNAHSFIISVPLAVEFAWTLRGDLSARRAGAAAALALCGLLGLAAALQAWPPADISSPSGHRSFSLLRAALLASEAVVDRLDIFSMQPPTGWSRLGGLAVTAAVITPIGLLSAAAGRARLFCGVLAAFLGFTAVQFGNLWHSGVLWLALLMLAWISWEGRSRAPAWRQRWLIGGLAVAVLCQDVATAKAWFREIGKPYSGAPAGAEALKVRLLAHPLETVAGLGDRSFGVQPWFARNLFANYRGGAAGPAYYVWSRTGSPPFTPMPRAWDAVLASGYDWVVVGDLNLLAPDKRAAFYRISAARSYCLKAAFPGAINWKGYSEEPDTLVLYGRCAARWAIATR